jgi:hypothetical protein
MLSGHGAVLFSVRSVLVCVRRRGINVEFSP